VLGLGSIAQKFEAFGWTVLTIEEGNNMTAVLDGLRKAIALTGQGKPIAIVMHTAMGSGVDFMEGTHHWHGIAPNDEQLARALNQLPETIGDY
jgi:transketolase